MKTIGFLLFFSAVIFSPGRLYPEDYFAIGVVGEAAGRRVIFQQYREGAWKEEAFTPGSRFEVNSSPAAAVGPDGAVWAVWAARKDGETPKIYFSRRGEGVWTEPRRVTGNDSGWEMTPAIAFDDSGLPIAAWSGERNETSRIYIARWNGRGFAAPEAVSPPGLSPVIHPALAALPGREIVLAWQGWDGEYYRLYQSFFNGRTWSEVEQLPGREEVDQVLPSLSASGPEGWECFWQEGGELLRSAGRQGTWEGPARRLAGKDGAFPPAGGLPPVGWVVTRDPEGNVRTRRTESFFLSPLPLPAARAGGGLGNRVYIGYGDSITYGTTPPGKNGCYIPLLKADLEAAHQEAYTIYNHGYPGANTYQLLYGGGSWGCPGIEAVVNHYNASHILIMGGTNDWSDNFPPSFSKTNLSAMIDRARAGGCEPVLATIIPACYYPGRFEWNEDLDRNYITPLAGEKSCLLADPFQAYIDYGPWKDLLPGDCIHPVWTEGSQLIADAWFAALSDPESTLPLLDSGDYDGDGSSDIALFRPANGLWAVKGVTRVYFGTAADIPASGDYDNDGTTDIAVFRASSGLWAVRGITRVYFGRTGDIAAPGDYTADGFCGPAVFRGSSGLWAIRGVTRCYYGASNDIPVPGYYRGNRGKDIAIFRPESGLWALRGLTRFYFGADGDQPAPADYGGDGTDRAAVFRPAAGLWAVRWISRYYFGAAADQPRPAPFGGGAAIGAVFRESSGLWALRGLSRVYFGTEGDIPLGGRIPRPVTPTPIPVPSPSPIPTPTTF